MSTQDITTGTALTPTATALTLAVGVAVIIGFLVMLAGVVMNIVGLVGLRRRSAHFMHALAIMGATFLLGITIAATGENRIVSTAASIVTLVLGLAMVHGIFYGLGDLAQLNRMPLLADKMTHDYRTYRNGFFILIALEFLVVFVGAAFMPGMGIMSMSMTLVSVMVLGFGFNYFFYIREMKVAGRYLNAANLADLDGSIPVPIETPASHTPDDKN